jgi:hypothetical protein
LAYQKLVLLLLCKPCPQHPPPDLLYQVWFSFIVSVFLRASLSIAIASAKEDLLQHRYCLWLLQPSSHPECKHPWPRLQHCAALEQLPRYDVKFHLIIEKGRA